MTKRSTLAVATASAALAVPATASAHVTLNPREVTAGSYSIMTVRVPNERDDKGTIKVDVRFPSGFYSASYKKVAGWTARITRKKLATPVDLGGGFKATEQITRIVWTGNRRKGGVIRPDQFEEFPLSVRVPSSAPNDLLMFRAYQTYVGGERVAWTAANPEADTPAPRVKLLPPAARIARFGQRQLG